MSLQTWKQEKLAGFADYMTAALGLLEKHDTSTRKVYHDPDSAFVQRSADGYERAECERKLAYGGVIYGSEAVRLFRANQVEAAQAAAEAYLTGALAALEACQDRGEMNRLPYFKLGRELINLGLLAL